MTQLLFLADLDIVYCTPISVVNIIQFAN